MSASEPQETNLVDTFQSLTVAFALAMTVRSFVTEGFVIPTGSMAPTLMGAHIGWQSPATGYRFAVDAGPVLEQVRVAGSSAMRLPRVISDPMLNPSVPIVSLPIGDLFSSIRMGDRVLVLKFLYAFFEPSRWDVVVFKNPTDPAGDTQNYIKRLVGLPNEQLIVIDGDVWTAPLGAPLSEFKITRKPDFVQEAVWQPVHDSDFIPVDKSKLAAVTKREWEGPPWVGEGWDLSGRAYSWPSADRAVLHWSESRMRISDWNAYNMWRPMAITYPVSDVRIGAALESESPEALVSDFELTARSHIFRWHLANGRVELSIRHMEANEVIASTAAPCVLPGRGRACDLEFWHVDQTMSLRLNGKVVCSLEYDMWTPEDRIRASFFGRTLEQYRDDPVSIQGPPPQIAWSFEGSSLSLRRVRVDRDLYYRPGILNRGDQFDVNGPPIDGFAFGTDIDHPAQLLEDQFLMFGDNSSASRDGRVWGRPHPLVVRELGVDAPFVVPRALLLGKAWSVYFPAPLPINTPGGGQGKAIVPDFGNLRFIR